MLTAEKEMHELSGLFKEYHASSTLNTEQYLPKFQLSRSRGGGDCCDFLISLSTAFRISVATLIGVSRTFVLYLLRLVRDTQGTHHVDDRFDPSVVGSLLGAGPRETRSPGTDLSMRGGEWEDTDSRQGWKEALHIRYLP